MTSGTAAPRRQRAAPSAVRAALLAVLVLAAGATLLATSRYGIAMTADSVTYRAGAQSLADGRGYTYGGSASTIFPPGYPAVLSVFERLGVDSVDGARVIAVLGFVGTTLLGFVLLRRHVRSPAVVVGGTVVIGCSAVLLWLFQKAFSEHVFIIVVLLLLLVAEDLRTRPGDRRLLVAAVALVWAGYYLRYAGLVLVPFMALVVVVTTWPAGRRATVLRATGFVVAALSVPALWMIRNSQAGSGPMGNRRDAAADLLTNVERTVLTLGGWLSFQGPTVLRLAALVGVLLAGAVLFLRIRPDRFALARGAQEMWPIALFIVVYVLYLVATATVVAFAPIYTRYLIPVYVPLVVLGAWAFDRALDRLGRSGQLVLATAALVWIAANVIWFGAHAVHAYRSGAGGYAAPEWQESRLIDEVATWSPTRPFVTNDVGSFELFLDRRVPETVAKTFVGSNERSGQLPAFVERVQCEGHLTLVWFNRAGTRTRLYSPEDLAEHLRVVPIVEYREGAIYDLAPLPSSPEAACDG